DQVDIRVLRVPDDLRGTALLAQRLHRVIELRPAALEIGRDVGTADRVVNPEERAVDMREPPGIDTCFGTREGALQLTAGASRRLEEAKRPVEIAVACHR